ncbi:cytochrome P450 [Xylariaceae sp. FL0255]|nr:cytochrome P450 [Xylariaceae sp. FL0255]
MRTGSLPFVGELEDEMRHAGLQSSDCARVLMIILHGVNSNVQMTTFWLMTVLLSDAVLMDRIRSETTPVFEALQAKSRSGAVSESDRHGIFRDLMMQSCPLLNSVFNEVVRVYSTGASVRHTTRNVTIGNKRVPAGTDIIMPHRQLLVDQGAFGEDAHIVNPERFIGSGKGRSLERHHFYRPFGGGTSMCSGRITGRYEVMGFAAIVLHRYNLELVKEGAMAFDGTVGIPLPRIDLKKPSLGVSKQVEGDDMIVEVRKRSTALW